MIFNSDQMQKLEQPIGNIKTVEFVKSIPGNRLYKLVVTYKNGKEQEFRGVVPSADAFGVDPHKIIRFDGFKNVTRDMGFKVFDSEFDISESSLLGIYAKIIESDDWWSKLSSQEQEKYLKDHPQSAKAKEIKRQQNQQQNSNPVKQEPKKPVSTNLGKILKLKDAMPDLDIGVKSRLNHVTDEEKRKVSMIIDKLAEMTQKAKESGEKAPDFDLCKITVPGTNLYCENNLGIPRAEMPQFKGFARPGSIADKLPKDPQTGEVDTEEIFKKMLLKKKIKVSSPVEFPSDRLKATQTQLVGAKVAGMTKALEKDPNHPRITAPIYVSRDGYVLDGHHRWAAMTSLAIKQDKPVNMKVLVVDLDGPELVKLANKFSDEIGIEQKKANVKEIKK